MYLQSKKKIKNKKKKLKKSLALKGIVCCPYFYATKKLLQNCGFKGLKKKPKFSKDLDMFIYMRMYA